MRAFIFLGGGESTHRFYSRHIEKTKKPGDVVICADGGYRVASSLDIRPDLVIGDLDSVSEQDIQRGIEIIRYPQEKDFSDFELALDRAIDSKAGHIFVYGGLGGRPDHQIVNIVLLAHSPVPMTFVEEHTLLFNVLKDWKIMGKKGCTCTLLTLWPACRVVDMHGFRYNLKNEDLIPSSRGLSNVIEEDEAYITVSQGSLIAIVLY